MTTTLEPKIFDEKEAAASEKTGAFQRWSAFRNGVAARRVMRTALSAVTLGRLTLYAIAAGLVVQAVLLTRVWLQLVGDTDRGGVAGFAYGLSDTLVAPFHRFEPFPPTQEQGILEFASLVAIEAYLVATMLVITVLLTLRLALLGGRTVVRHSRRRAAARISSVPSAR